MKTSFTPVPWILDDESTFIHDGNKSDLGFLGLVIADCESIHRPHKEQVANARLCVAAPELYEMIERLSSHICDIGASRKDADLVDAAADLLAKARGEKEA